MLGSSTRGDEHSRSLIPQLRLINDSVHSIGSEEPTLATLHSLTSDASHTSITGRAPWTQHLRAATHDNDAPRDGHGRWCSTNAFLLLLGLLSAFPTRQGKGQRCPGAAPCSEPTLDGRPWQPGDCCRRLLLRYILRPIAHCCSGVLLAVVVVFGTLEATELGNLATAQRC
jgi:hypothetical protein